MIFRPSRLIRGPRLRVELVDVARICQCSGWRHFYDSSWLRNVLKSTNDAY